MKIKQTLSVLVGVTLLVSKSQADDVSTNQPTAATPLPTTLPTTEPATTPALVATNLTDAAPWRFGFDVPIWTSGLNGNATLGGRQKNLDVGFDQLKDHLENAFSLALNLSKGKFGLYADVFYNNFKDYSTFSSAKMKFLVSEAHVSYQVINVGEKLPFSLEAIAGARYWHTTTDLVFRGPGGIIDYSSSEDRNVVDPIIGLSVSQYLTRKLHLDFQGDIGGFNISKDTDMTWSATGVATYDFTKWFSFSGGYRAVALDQSNGSGANKSGLNIVLGGMLLSAQFKF